MTRKNKTTMLVVKSSKAFEKLCWARLHLLVGYRKSPAHKTQHWTLHDLFSYVQNFKLIATTETCLRNVHLL